MTPANFSGWLYEKSDDDYSPAFARELLEVVTEPALLVDTIRGQIVAVNSQFRKFTGWDEKFLTQQPVRHILSGMEDRQLIAGGGSRVRPHHRQQDRHSGGCNCNQVRCNWEMAGLQNYS